MNKAARLLAFTFAAVYTGGCDRGGDVPEKPEAPLAPAPEPIPLRSENEREFDTQLNEIHEKWVGTAWAFSGTSQVAGEGSIACGYFVTTTLREAGMEVERIRLAQAASETMILAIADPDSIRRFSNATLANFLTSIRKQGEGYYIVGLDSHTGFLKVEQNGEVAFIHSGPGRGVVFQKPEDARELATSKYRVTGKIGPKKAAESES